METKVEENGNGHGGSRAVPSERYDPRYDPERLEARQLEPLKKISAGRQSGRGLKDMFQIGGGEVRRPLGRDTAAIEALRLIRDLDPVASNAVFVLLRLLNPGHDLKAYVFSEDGSEENEDGFGQQVLDDLARRVGSEYGGGLDQLVNVLGLSILTHGAVAAEVAPTEDLRDTEDWYPIDPILLSYKRIGELDDAGNEIAGTPRKLRLGQRFGAGRWVPLNEEQVFYLPLDPDVDDPYGRPPLIAAIGPVMHLAGMLTDLRQAAHAAGYPRLSVKVVWEIIKSAAPAALLREGQEAAFAAWAQNRLDEIVDTYNSLSTDDTIVHFDWVELGSVGGVGQVSFDFGTLEKVLLRQLVSALKTLPILLGINESTSETHGSVQWQIQVAMVEAMRKLVKRIVEKMANVSLQLAGAWAHAKLEYTEIRTVDRRFEAEAELVETKTRAMWVEFGWIDNDEAAIEMTGHAAVGMSQAEMFAEYMSTVGDQAPKSDDEVQRPTEAEKAMIEAGWSPLALEILKEARTTGTVSQRTRDMVDLLDRANRAQAEENAPDRTQHIRSFEDRAVIIFRSLADELAALLEAEGFEVKRFAVAEQVARDIVESIFGLSYSRQMKGLLRDAVRFGLEAAGTPGLEPARRVVDRIWNENRTYVDHIKNDLRAALQAGEFSSLDDIRAWFEQESWREQLMGRYLAKQGIEAGYAQGLEVQKAGTVRFQWTLGDVATQHCVTCLDRADNAEGFTYEELVSLGFPGSTHLDCGANCACTLVEV